MGWFLRAVVVGLCAAGAWADDAAAPPVAQYEGKTAAEWTSQLASEDVKLRQKAAYALFKLGPDAKAAPLPLVKAIRDADPYVRTTSAKAVEKLGADAAKPVVGEIASEMSDERPEVRREAASLLWRLGPLAADVVPELTKSLASPDELVRANAAGCLANAGAAAKPALAAVVKALDDGDENVRKWAAKAVVAIDPVAAFASERGAVRFAAIQAYSEPNLRGWTKPEIVACVVKAVDDGNEEVRSWAVHALDTFAAFSGDERPVEWIAVFRRVLETQRAAGPRAAAAAGLGRYPAHAADVLPPLVAAMNGREPEVKTAAVLALGWLGPKSAPAVPGMVECLRDDDTQVRDAAAYSLGLIGDASDPVVTALVGRLHDDDRMTRRNAIGSLGRLGTGSARVADALVGVIAEEDADPYVAGDAVTAIVAAGLRDRAVSALSAGLPKDAPAPPVVAFALCALDAPAAAKSLDDLIAMASKGERLSDVLAALRLLGPKAVRAVAVIVPHLVSADAQTRISAAVALGAIGPGAKDALPALERMASDADPIAVVAAKQAIDEIRPKPDAPK